MTSCIILLLFDMFHHYFKDGYSVQLVQEGEEPENFFWFGIGGHKEYEKVFDFINYLCKYFILIC